MASVVSLGLDQPAGLQYAIQEHLLPPEAPSTAYSWHNHFSADVDADSICDEDELLVTEQCVIWSRGGVFRKSYKFDLEKEPVTQALLTSFPSVEPLGKKDLDSSGKKAASRKSAAIVVFLKTQAHVHFLSGTSHVIHLPFEVEFVTSAPNGLIIQRKLRVDNLVPASLKFPRVPPNSFVSSQPQPWSASSSQQSTFSVADLGAPKQMSLQFNSTLKDLWDPPTLTDDANWPRLFSLSDPLSEMGLVVAQPQKPDLRGHRRGSIKKTALDTAEEILHVSRQDEFEKCSDGLVLALTLNRETSMYTVWRLSYVGEENMSETHRIPSDSSRRRSSFVPGTAAGATTPVVASQSTFRESFGVNTAAIGTNPIKKHAIATKDKAVDFASTLDPDFESSSIPRRKSRRVSSMLARADLSASNERSAFSELASNQQHATKRRGDSLGSQHTRTSTGGYAVVGGPSFTQASQFNQSLNNFLEAPVDDLLDELRAGGDFEGFHNMGLDDEEFDALRQEIILTKVCSVPAEHSNVRYSSQHMPATSQCKIFTLTAPPSAIDEQQRNTIVICILDPDEKKLLVLTLYTHFHSTTHPSENPVHGRRPGKQGSLVSLGPVVRADRVIDACRLDDGHISRILILTETDDGYGELSMQAPWSVLMKIPLPRKFAISNIRNLGHNAIPRAKREGGFKRVLSQGPRALRGLRNSKPHGLVDLVDDEGKLHQIQIQLEPRNPHVSNILEICRTVIPGVRGGEGVLKGWWDVMQWLRLEAIETVDPEWAAVAIILFTLVLGLSDEPRLNRTKAHAKRKSRTGLLRSSSGAQSDSESWQTMLSQEASIGNPLPPWSDNAAWKWLAEDEQTDVWSKELEADSPILTSDHGNDTMFVPRHVKLAQDFASSTIGREVVTDTLPTSKNRDVQARKAALIGTVTGLHLLREEHKLNTMATDSCSTGVSGLAPILGQMVHWLGWSSWVEHYDVDEVSLLDLKYDSSFHMDHFIPEPFECPSVYQWVQTCLTSQKHTKFITLPSIVASHSQSPGTNAYPRILLFENLFASMHRGWSPAQFVESLASAGIDVLLLETLPEAILAPLQEAIVQCQAEPPTTWNKQLLALTGREDVNMLLTPGQRPRHAQSGLLVPSHESHLDVHAICVSTADPEAPRALDQLAEIDRQIITRAIFKDDRRVNEAMGILNTSRPTVARCKAEPRWTESDLLEAQKDHAQMLAYRTLATPSGRGLLYFSAREPLLTERLSVGGFNLSCVMKPDNNTVGVDKNAFTEEKVCWAFFHSGVAAGLSISRDAKGIDTSWIIFNKPAQDLSNRHAGFLLALGLNGHLKSVAKWVAFKYLTPKHTMTSIGLLLGLAASYLGTMDSLITRLLSVHVTRMLPPGAAELNLSPLTQTTGIMGIGILYCNTQHRRMSEIMVSEIEHIDSEIEEEPLRNEGYRLAAGFALGFINLGKGSDLKGLHDMRLTERLLALAAGSKRVDLVHVLDKATAGAVVAIALIFMKSENQVLARKVDIPDSLLQFDYVRPDMFLLRTLARHLIMWSKIEPSSSWIKNNLPPSYRGRSSLESVKNLTTDDLPFYDIITGLCFSIALRFAGSGSHVVRDLFIHYLDQLMRICRIDADTYDKKLTRNTIRNCQDLLALGLATVMAGTGDLVVFRRLRSMHGRDNSETPYGSHLAAHLAIGALFLGGGTHTFGTSNLAIASLLVAFYPIFPSSVQDNQSHLQAFRHFWALAAEPRCLVTRDIDTNQPVPMPITVTLQNDEQIQRHTPCLLPELDQIKTVRTASNEHWNIVLDFAGNPAHITSFKSTRTVHVRRRPAHDGNISAFQTTLQALNSIDGISTSHSLEWLFELPAFASLTKAERALVLPPENGGASDIQHGTKETVVDARLVLDNATIDGGKRDRLLGLRLLFEWADMKAVEGKELLWIRREVVERLKARVWMAAEGAT